MLIARLWLHVFHGYRARGRYIMCVPRVAIPLMTIPRVAHDKLHETCTYVPRHEKRGPHKHVTGLFVTRHEKTGLMYTKYTCSYYCEYLPYCIRYSQSVSCMRFLTNCCINGEKFVRLLCLHKKLFNFGIQKCGQISCAHKTHFLMPGHI